MLQRLNERIKGVVAWVIIALIAITFALFGIDYYMQTHHSSAMQVEVNGEPVNSERLERSFRQARQSSQRAGESEQTLRNRVLEDLILNEVSLQAARRNGFEVTQTQTDATILDIPQFQEDGRFSTQRYEQLLSNNLYTSGSFREEVRQGMLLNQQRFAFIGSSFALPNEIDQFVSLFLQSRDYSYLQVPLNLFINPTQISQEAIQKFYEEHNKEFLEPEKVSIEYVRLSAQDIKDKLKISDEKAKQYYEENPNGFLTPVHWQVLQIKFPISEKASPEEREKVKQNAELVYQNLQKEPQLFSELSKQKSENKKSASNQEKPIWIAAGQTEFDDALAQLTKPGQISPPVSAANEYVIFKLVEHLPAHAKPFALVKSEIKTQLQNELLQSSYAQAVEELSDLSYQSPDSLQPVANSLKLPILHTPPFSQKNVKELLAKNAEIKDSELLLLKNEQIVAAAFSHDVLNLGNNSEPIQLDDNSVVVLRIKEHIPTKKQTLEEVKSLITDKLAKKAAAIEAKNFVTKFLATKDEQEQTKLLKTYKMKWQEIKEASRNSKKVEEHVNEFAFSLLPTVGCDARLNDNDYLIVCLKKVNKGQLQQLDKERQTSLAQQIESSYGMMDYDLYIKQLLSTAQVDRR